MRRSPTASPPATPGRRAHKRPAAAALIAGPAAVLLAGCGAHSSPPTPTPTRTVIGTRTATPSVGPTAPVRTGPTTAATAASCPLLGEQATADRVGMRLERITVLHSGGRVVGCRFYALQDSPLHASEHLPGPHQPAVEVLLTRYPSSVAAHNAFVRLADKGTTPQVEVINPGNRGVCYRTEFYPKDHGRDWACAFSLGTTAVEVRTVVVSPALNVVLVAREVAGKL